MFARLTTRLKRRLLTGGKLAQRSTLLTGLAGALLCAAPATGAELSWGEQKLLETFEALESGSMDPPEAREHCRRYLNVLPHAFIDPMRELASGLLDVHRSFTSDTVCTAMVDLNLSGRLPTQQLRAAAEAEDEEVQALEVGRILRAVYFAYHDGQADPRSDGVPQ